MGSKRATKNLSPTAVKMLAAANGALTIAELAESIGCSYSHVYTTAQKLHSAGYRIKLATRYAARAERVQRDNKIVSAVLRGQTFAAIAERMGMTHERVRQIVAKHGVQSVRAWPIRIAQRRKREREDARARAIAHEAKRQRFEQLADRMLALVNSGESILGAARRLGVSSRRQIIALTRARNLGAVSRHGRWPHRRR
jgi:biotin operon repressor